MIDYETERVARAIARVHFSRKQYPANAPKEAYIRHQVEVNWRNHVEHAKAAIAAQDDGFSGTIAEKAMLKQIVDSAVRSLWLIARQIGGIKITRAEIEDFDNRRARIVTRTDHATGDYLIEASIQDAP